MLARMYEKRLRGCRAIGYEVKSPQGIVVDFVAVDSRGPETLFPISVSGTDSGNPRLVKIFMRHVGSIRVVLQAVMAFDRAAMRVWSLSSGKSSWLSFP